MGMGVWDEGADHTHEPGGEHLSGNNAALVDQRLQSLLRALSESPGDAEAAARLRAALDRLDPRERAPYLDELVGAYAACEVLALEPPEKRLPPRWRRVSGGRLDPRLPRQARVRWRLPGVLVALDHAGLLVEAPDGALERRDLVDGALRWRVESLVARELAELIPGAGQDQAQRLERAPWVATPWGAAEVAALHAAPLEFRRVGRYHAELGRVTEKQAVDRGEGTASLLVHVLLPRGGSWSAAPEALIEEAGPGELLAGAEQPVRGWDDTLLALSLDPRQPELALFAGDEERDGLLFEVDGTAGLLSVLPYPLAADEPALPRELGRPEGPLTWWSEADQPGGIPGDPRELELALEGCTLVPWKSELRPGRDAALFPLDGAAVLAVAGESIALLA